GLSVVALMVTSWVWMSPAVIGAAPSLWHRLPGSHTLPFTVDWGDGPPDADRAPQSADTPRDRRDRARVVRPRGVRRRQRGGDRRGGRRLSADLLPVLHRQRRRALTDRHRRAAPTGPPPP